MDFYDFFSGAGMARIGLGPEWNCIFANDIDEKKGDSYKGYFGPSRELRIRDVRDLSVSCLPGRADLAWASFPCQDLSLAGNGLGLDGERSGTFWAFWDLMQDLREEGRAPRMIILENVRGAITSHQGRDLAAICNALSKEGYKYAPLVIDAVQFVPQSRPRLFIVAFGPEAMVPTELIADEPTKPWHMDSFLLAYNQLEPEAEENWLWLSLPTPPLRLVKLSDLIDDEPRGIEWHDADQTDWLLSLMTPVNRQKVEMAQADGRRRVGALYKRTRREKSGRKQQRAEVRFDEVAGCLRSPGGGSSRQTILVVEGEKVRSRLLSTREAARLMGVPDDYPLPLRYNEAYRLMGDGVVVPVVDWLARNVVEPALLRKKAKEAA